MLQLLLVVVFAADMDTLVVLNVVVAVVDAAIVSFVVFVDAAGGIPA